MASITGNEPVNLLALDGGGIRGVSELVILHEVMVRIQERGELERLPKPCEFFHIIGGTSTGGLVAIMLGRLEMSTQDALKAYDSFAGRIFSKSNLKGNGQFDQMYKAKGLEKTIQQLVSEQSKGVKMADSKQPYERGRAFVCSKRIGDRRSTVRFRTYDVTGDGYQHIKIWEAARATTAAPRYFKPMEIMSDDTKSVEKFVDGAIGCNNPTEVLIEEADLLYGKKRNFGCLVSLGTGTKEQELAESSKTIVGKLSWAMHLAMVMKEITVDCEETHERMRKKFESFPSAYFRFNVANGAEGIKLEDWKMMKELKEKTKAYLQKDDVKTLIDDLADVLLHRSTNHGLTLGHIVGLDQESLLLDTHVAIPRGRASRIFTGREMILRRMEGHFGDRGPGDHMRREFHLRGLGGMGKTQIALQFADWNDRRFRVIWIDATNQLTIEQSYRKYGEQWFPDQDPSRVARRLINWLARTDEEWLLVFDNANETGLKGYIPDGNTGNIIYTSRPRDLKQRFRPESIQDVESMEPGDAVTLLLRAANLDQRDRDIRKTARPIVDELGCLPLAIDQAGAYVDMAPCPLNQFLDVYNKQKEVLLKNTPFRGEDQERNLPVYATFNISFEAIQAYAMRRRDMEKVQGAISAIRILCIICFYHNEGLFRDIFSSAAERRDNVDRNVHYPLMVGDSCLNELVKMTDGAWESENFDKGIKFLQDFSLVKLDNDTNYTSMHVLVHEWARGRLNDASRAGFGFAARAILLDSVTFKSSMPCVLHRRALVPHLDACTKYSNSRHEDDILESEYDSKYAFIQMEACRFEEAEAALKHAIHIRQFEYGFFGRETHAAMSQLGRVYLLHGRFDLAEAILVETIQRREMAYQEKKEAALKEHGARDLEQARKQKIPETQHKSAAISPASTSQQLDDTDSDNDETDDDGHGVYDALGDPAVPRREHEEYLDRRHHEKLEHDKFDLASVYIRQDQISRARQLVAEVVDSMRQWYGTRSRNYTFKRAQGYLELLEQVEAGGPRQMSSSQARRNLEAARRLSGRTAPRTMGAKMTLAGSLTAEGQFKEAEDLYSELLYYHNLHYGDTALETMDIVEKLGILFNQDNRHIEAADLHQHALQERETKLTRNHPHTLNSMEGLAIALANQGRVDEALPLLRECAERRTVVLGANHRATEGTRNFITRLAEWQPKVTPAVQARLRNKQLEKLRSNMGEFAPEWLRNWQPQQIAVEEPPLLAGQTTVQS